MVHGGTPQRFEFEDLVKFRLTAGPPSQKIGSLLKS